MQGLRQFLRGKAYQKETSYLLNHFTLKVRDPVVEKEIQKYGQQQFEKL